jgi:hypothetical protein
MAVCVLTGHVDRIISIDCYGRKFMQCIDKRERSGFISIHYSSRALEWINVCRLFQELLIFFQFSHMYSLVENITFAWSYDSNLASVLYKPAVVLNNSLFCISYMKMTLVHALQLPGLEVFVILLLLQKLLIFVSL